MNANLELYKIFCDVVKYGNISKTAENIYISQSAVTQSIQKLENILGGKLFFRNKKGVELTAEGKKLYEYINDSIDTMSNAESIFSQYVNLEKGNVRIGGGRILINKYILPSLIKFVKDYPNIEINISRNSSDEALKKVSQGELDLAIYNEYENSKKYSNIEIYQINNKGETYVFYTSKEYLEKHEMKENLDINNKNIVLPKSNIAKDRFKEYCKENNIKNYIKYEVQDSYLLNQLVQNGCGIGFSIKEYIDVDLLNNNDIVILRELEHNDDKISIATLSKNMCNKPTLELIKRIEKSKTKF